MSEENKPSVESESQANPSADENPKETAVDEKSASKEETQSASAGSQAAASLPRPSRQWLFPLMVAVVALAVGSYFFRADLLCWVANRCIQSRRYDEAQRWLDWSKDFATSHAETEFLLARVARHRGDGGDTERFLYHLDQAEDLGYDSVRIERERLLAEAQSGRMAVADPYRKQLFEDQRGDGVEIVEAFVMGYLQTYRLNEALLLIEHWIKDYPNDPQPYYLRGLVKQEFAQWDEAEKDFEQAIRSDPEYFRAHLGLGQVLLEKNEPELATARFEAALTSSRLETQAKTGLAACNSQMENPDEARRLLEEVLAADAAYAPAVRQLARLEMTESKFEKAYELLGGMLEKDPYNLAVRKEYVNAMEEFGKATDNEKKVQEASQIREMIQEAESALVTADTLKARAVTEPDNVKLRQQIGEIYMRYGSPEEAVVWYRSVLQLEPENSQAHQALAQYYTTKVPQTEADKSLALEHSARAAGAAPTPPPSPN